MGGFSEQVSCLGRAAIAIIVINMTCLKSAAAVPDFSEWLDARLKSPPAAERLSGIKLTWKEQSFSRMTEEQFAKLKQDVAADASDNRRFAIAPEELFRKAPDGAVPTEFTVWWKDESNWRFSYTYPKLTDKSGVVLRAASFEDRIATQNRTWMLTPESLLIADPRKHPDAVQSVQAMYTTFRSQLGMLVDAGLSSRMAGARIKSTLQGKDGWEAIVSGNIAEVRINAAWESKLSTFVIKSIRYLRHPDGSRRLGGWDFSEWKAIPSAGTGVIATQATEVAPDGRIVQRLLVGAMEPISRSEFDEISAVPSAIGSDPFRGALTVTSVFDYVAQEYKEKNKQASGQQPTWTAKAELKDSSEDSDRVRTTGWILLILLGATLLFVELRRLRRS